MKEAKRLKKWLKKHNKSKHQFFKNVSESEKSNEPHLFYSDTLKCAKEIIKHDDMYAKSKSN